MRAFLRFVVRGRVYAIAAATTAAMLSVLLAVMVVVFPPLFFAGVVAYFASASIVGLVALKFGLLEALVVMVGPTLFWAAPLVAGSEVDAPATLLAVPVVSTVVGILLPVALMGEVLRRTRSQALAFGVGAGLLAVVTTAFHIVDFELLRWLTSEMLPALKRSMPEVDWQIISGAGQGGTEGGGQQALATGIYAANSLVVLMLSLVVARWWHAILDNPGGFGAEFRALQFGRAPGYVAAALVLVGGFLDGWLGNLGLKLLPSVLVLALFQGLSVAHGLARGRSGGRHLLIGMYLLLVVPLFNTLTLVVVMVTGMVDPWVGFRERWARS